jgi:hypothetical protein
MRTSGRSSPSCSRYGGGTAAVFSSIGVCGALGDSIDALEETEGLGLVIDDGLGDENDVVVGDFSAIGFLTLAFCIKVGVRSAG